MDIYCILYSQIDGGVDHEKKFVFHPFASARLTLCLGGCNPSEPAESSVSLEESSIPEENSVPEESSQPEESSTPEESSAPEESSQRKKVLY